MSDAPLDTVWLHGCIERWRGGDRAAADELLRAVAGRMEHLAHRMLGGFANVRRQADTADVLQGALFRLLHTLRNVRPTSSRDFVNLAAVHIRRELLDLARHAAVRERHRVPADGAANGGEGDVLAAATAADTPPDELELWTRFHQAVEQLPGEQREVVSLMFYHGWSRAQIAELFGVDERTVRRRWQSACLRLNGLVGGELPRA